VIGHREQDPADLYAEREPRWMHPPMIYPSRRPLTLEERLVETLNESHETIRVALALADALT
jgi:hypothetical protein